MMIDGIPNRPFYFYQKDIIAYQLPNGMIFQLYQAWLVL